MLFYSGIGSEAGPWLFLFCHTHYSVVLLRNGIWGWALALPVLSHRSCQGKLWSSCLDEGKGYLCEKAGPWLFQFFHTHYSVVLLRYRIWGWALALLVLSYTLKCCVTQVWDLRLGPDSSCSVIHIIVLFYSGIGSEAGLWLFLFCHTHYSVFLLRYGIWGWALTLLVLSYTL